MVVPTVFWALKTISLTSSPLHTTTSDIEFISKFGLTVIVKVISSPVHANGSVASYEGVTVMFAVIGSFVSLFASKLDISPVPLAPNPILVLSFVQLYIVVPFVLAVLNTISAISSPLQTTIGSTSLT